MPDPACPRCGVPLHDQPDYCWSCGFYVGDRWRTTQLPEGDTPEPRVVGPDEAVAEARVVGGAADPSRSQLGMDRWLARLVAVAAVVIIGLLALALLGGGSDGGGADASTGTGASVGASPHRTGTSGDGPFVSLWSPRSEG